jgi:hypothetical protein
VVWNLDAAARDVVLAGAELPPAAAMQPVSLRGQLLEDAVDGGVREGHGLRALEEIQMPRPSARRLLLPRTVFLPLVAALLALRVSAGRRGCLLRGLTCRCVCSFGPANYLRTLQG